MMIFRFSFFIACPCRFVWRVIFRENNARVILGVPCNSDEKKNKLRIFLFWPPRFSFKVFDDMTMVIFSRFFGLGVYYSMCVFWVLLVRFLVPRYCRVHACDVATRERGFAAMHAVRGWEASKPGMNEHFTSYEVLVFFFMVVYSMGTAVEWNSHWNCSGLCAAPSTVRTAGSSKTHPRRDGNAFRGNMYHGTRKTPLYIRMVWYDMISQNFALPAGKYTQVSNWATMGGGGGRV